MILGHWINCFFAADVCQFSYPVKCYLIKQNDIRVKKIDVFFNPNFFSVYDAGVCLFFCVKFLLQVNNFCIIFLLSVILCISTTIQRIVMWNAFKELHDQRIIIHNLLWKTCFKKTVHICILFVYFDRKCTMITYCNITSIKTIYVDVLNVCITTQWRNVFNLCTATGPSSFIDIHYIHTQYCERIMICLQINSHVPKLSHL